MSQHYIFNIFSILYVCAHLKKYVQYAEKLNNCQFICGKISAR